MNLTTTTTTKTKTKTTALFHPDRDNTNENNDNQTTVYCHLHIEKTAGTTINGYLALNYERVCGNKGYSLTYSKHNSLLRQANTHRVKGHGRVKAPEMDDIGYEDCDYISWERPWNSWFRNEDAAGVANGDDDGNDDSDEQKEQEESKEKTANKKTMDGTKQMSLLNQSNVRYELHLPCRETISHFLSRCNYREYDFNCLQPWQEQIPHCIKTQKYPRFRRFLNDSFEIRCFNASKLNGYFGYMDTKLQRKRTAFTSEYFHRNTNRPRKPNCLEKDRARQDQIKASLRETNDYYGFCEECMGSWQELPLEE